MPRKPLAAVLVAVAALVLGAAASAETGLRPVAPVSPNVERSTDIYYLIAGLTGLVFLAVTIPLVLFIVRFRSRGRDRAVEGPQIRGNTRLELAWTAVPIVLLTIATGFVFYKLPGITDISANPGNRGDFEVRVEGRQYYWQYEYENGVIAIDKLRAPADAVVELAITAPKGDVQHSFWVPPVGGKFDALPGQINETSFRVSKLGIYRGQCAEFCGLQHAAMLASIEIVPRDEFERWLAQEGEAQRAGTSDLGEQEWRGVCAKCHGPKVVGEVGPALEGNPIVADAEAVEAVVRNGRGAMPPVGQGWTEHQMRALTRYLKENVAEADADGG